MNYSIFDRLLTSLEQLPMTGIVERAADRQEDLMIELNVAQMQAGIKATGAPITPPYTARTVYLKQKKGQPTNRVTLHDTGDFQNAERVKRYPGGYELYSQDAKEEELIGKYGYDIHGLTDSNLSIVRDKMIPFMTKDARNLIVFRR